MNVSICVFTVAKDDVFAVERVVIVQRIVRPQDFDIYGH